MWGEQATLEIHIVSSNRLEEPSLGVQRTWFQDSHCAARNHDKRASPSQPCYCTRQPTETAIRSHIHSEDGKAEMDSARSTLSLFFDKGRARTSFEAS